MTKAAATIHRTKLFGGRHTAEEYHQRYAFPPGAKCAGCSRPPLTRAMTFMPLDELQKRDPAFAVLAEVAPEKILAMIVQFKGSEGKPVPHVRIATVYACKSCTPTMEKSAARAPSYAVVEIHRGVGPDRPMFGPTTFDDRPFGGPSLFMGAEETTPPDPMVEQAVANMRKDILSQ